MVSACGTEPATQVRRTATEPVERVVTAAPADRAATEVVEVEVATEAPVEEAAAENGPGIEVVDDLTIRISNPTPGTKAFYEVVETLGLAVYADGEMLPVYACDWEVSSDAGSWEFFLCEEAMLHSGAPVTATFLVDPFHAVESDEVSASGELEEAVSQAIGSNHQAVADYKAGKETAIKFLVGQVMKATRGRANPKLANELLIEKLKEV